MPTPTRSPSVMLTEASDRWARVAGVGGVAVGRDGAGDVVELLSAGRADPAAAPGATLAPEQPVSDRAQIRPSTAAPKCPRMVPPPGSADESAVLVRLLYARGAGEVAEAARKVPREPRGRVGCPTARDRGGIRHLLRGLFPPPGGAVVRVDGGSRRGSGRGPGGVRTGLGPSCLLPGRGGSGGVDPYGRDAARGEPLAAGEAVAGAGAAPSMRRTVPRGRGPSTRCWWRHCGNCRKCSARRWCCIISAI